jgi:hypothetical protein
LATRGVCAGGAGINALGVGVSYESASFLKKRSKKFLHVKARVVTGTKAKGQKFFGSFFQKRTAFFLDWS